jgi:hypothetical protein
VAMREAKARSRTRTRDSTRDIAIRAQEVICFNNQRFGICSNYYEKAI